MSWSGPGIELGLWKALCQPSVLLWQGHVRCMGEGLVSLVLPQPWWHLRVPPPPHLRTGQASLWRELAAPRVSGEVAMLTTVLDVVFFVTEGTAAWTVTSAMALMLGESLREEMTAASCGAAGAGGKAEAELLFIVLSKCFLASEGTGANEKS